MAKLSWTPNILLVRNEKLHDKKKKLQDTFGSLTMEAAHVRIVCAEPFLVDVVCADRSLKDVRKQLRKILPVRVTFS
jgi:hypothetical protein